MNWQSTIIGTPQPVLSVDSQNRSLLEKFLQNPSNTASARLELDQDAMLELLRELTLQYVDVEHDAFTPSAELAAIGVDSLTLAELLFSLEERLGIHMEDPAEMPLTVGDVIAYASPYLQQRLSAGLH